MQANVDMKTTHSLQILFSVFTTITAVRRIVGGRDVFPDEFPFVASFGIQYGDQNHYMHLCSCTILTPTWTISAAHCHVGAIAYVIRHSIHSPDEPGKYARVQRIVSHPVGFRLPSYNGLSHLHNLYDVCLIGTEAIALNRYGTLSGVDHRSLIGHHVFVLGYGITNSSGVFDDAVSLNRTLQVYDGMVTNCLEGDRAIYTQQVCLMPKCGAIALLTPGDSGGPVLHESGVVGVNSASAIESDTKRKFMKLSVKSFALHSTGIVAAVNPCMDWITRVTTSSV